MVMIGLLRWRLSTRIRPAASRSRNARSFVFRRTPKLLSCPFGSWKVLLLAFHAKCNSHRLTNARGVRVARVACSAHRSGTLIKRSALFGFGLGGANFERFDCNVATVT